MRRRLGIVLSLLITSGSAWSSLRFGTGNAVAHRSGEVVNKAGTVVGPDGGLPLLPSCGSNMALFTAPPVTDPTFVSFAPIGHVFPPGHTFPADHSYFNFSGQTSGINLYAPGDGWVTQVISLIGVGNTSAGYVIQFSPCQEVKLDNLSVNTISPDLINPPGSSRTTCSSDGQGFPGAVSSCTTSMEVPVKAGQLLGTGGLVDFGPIEDTRMQIQGFANPARHNLNRGFCPINYFTPSLKTAYTAILGGNTGATLVPRTIPPLCGTIMQDVAGTAQGDWYFPGASDIPDNPHLALIHHNIAASTGTFSSGTSIPNFAGAHDFYPKTVTDGSRINYDFNLVTDGQIYCYDSLLIELNNGPGGADPSFTGHIVLLQLSGASRENLKIELQNPGMTCAGVGSGSWAFTGSAVNYQR